MRFVDAHVHLYPPEVNADPAGWAAAHGEPGWATLCTRVRRNGRAVQAFPSVDELLREMDAANVERAVLLGWYWHRLENCTMQNRFYAECVRRHPDRLSAFATIQPSGQQAAAEAELRRARDDGLVGLGELSPHTHGYGPADDAFTHVLERTAEWGWPVNLHVTDPATPGYPGRVETPLEDFLALARAQPQVTFVLAHWGGLLPLRDATAAELRNVYYDTAASPLTYDDSVWSRFLAVVPPERVLFGSDYPLNLYPRQDAAPGLSRFVAEAQHGGASLAVMRENALRLLGRAG